MSNWLLFAIAVLSGMVGAAVWQIIAVEIEIRRIKKDIGKRRKD